MRINNYSSNVMGAQETGQRKSSVEAAKQEMVGTVNNEKRSDISADNLINDDMLENAVKQANKNLDQYNKVIERSVHEKTHTIMYVLKDTVTDEIIKEFPPRKIQDMIAKMWEMAGILVDERR